jgi:DNA-binding CsgD family transcriptional regulator
MVVCFAALALYDDVAWHDLNRRWVAQARERGAVTALLLALTFRTFDDVAEGRLEDAEAAVAEGRALVVATGDRVQLNALDDAELQVLAWRGREAAARALGAQVLRNCADKGDALTMRVAHGALAVLELSLGNYEPALRHGLGAFEDEPVTTRDSEVDLVEAAVRCGDRQAAAAVLQAFSPRVQASGTEYALGELARCRALLAADDRAEPEYQLAIAHLQRCRITPQLARTQLLYGEWLRRRRRRRDARDQLRTAFGMFDAMGMDAFADRARSELRATGERVPKRTLGSRGVLTPQEEQIARLASDGASNKEIAAQLFLSTHTVDYHLVKVFRKLDITNRAQLARALAGQDRPDPVTNAGSHREMGSRGAGVRGGGVHPVANASRARSPMPVHTTSSAKWLCVPGCAGDRRSCPATCDVAGGAGMARRAVVLQQGPAGELPDGEPGCGQAWFRPRAARGRRRAGCGAVRCPG